MTIDDQISDEKLQYDINREAAKISALSSGKIHKYEYLTGEDILSSSNQQIIKQARFTYSPLHKAFNKQINSIKDHGEKQIKTLKSIKKLSVEDVIPNSAFATDEANEELNKIKEIEKNVNREKVFNKSNKNTYNFKDFRTIRTFGEYIYEGETTLDEADEDQSDLADRINDFIKKTRPQSQKKKQEKEIVKKNLINFYEAREAILNAFKSKIFLKKSTGSGISDTDNSKLKILTPKQMLERLLIALAQVKAGNNSENLLNEIRQIIYSLYQSKEITKKMYSNFIRSL